MSAVNTLLLTYFLRVPQWRWIAAVGLAMALTGWIFVPETFPAVRMIPVVFGGFMVVIGSNAVSAVAGHLAKSRTGHLLLHVRLRLLSSAVVALALFAAPLALPLREGFDMQGLMEFLRGFPGAFLVVSWYAVAGYFLRNRHPLAGVFVLLGIVAVIAQRDVHAGWALLQLGLTWTVILAWLFLPGRKEGGGWNLPGLAQGWWSRKYLPGRELGIILRTTRAWLILVYMACVLVMVLAFSHGSVVFPVFFLSFLCFMFGAASTAATAAGRSRALWLRLSGSRAALFEKIEAAYWRQNAILLAFALVLLVAVNVRRDAPLQVLLLGVPQLVMAVALGTYFGLLRTRATPWFHELGLKTLFFVIAAVAMVDPLMLHATVALVVAQLVCIVGIVMLRFVARARWSAIDWTECRPPPRVNAGAYHDWEESISWAKQRS